MGLHHSELQEELADIEKRIIQYEKASRYMVDVEKQLQDIMIEGFETDIDDIRRNLTDLDAHGKVHQMMNILQEDIQKYQIEYDLLLKEFNNLPLDMIDDSKRDEIKTLLSSPKTINQAQRWIRNIKKYIDSRNRICFPKELTQYTNEYLIGTGGFSRVYKVKNIKSNRVVAVKIPIKNDEEIGRSFLRELNNWVSLDHQNIVKIYQYNILPVLYIEMEYCDTCLDDIKKPVQLNLALHYIHGIATGLHYAHQHNIAHLDLKPQNILLKNDLPKITDWGLSRALTIPGTTTLGITYPFAAPEQFSTKYGKKDAKTDIWQIGVLLYYMLTNSFPFQGKDFAEYGKNVTNQDIKKTLNKEESVKEVSHILEHCMSRRKSNRYKDLSFFIDGIEEIL